MKNNIVIAGLDIGNGYVKCSALSTKPDPVTGMNQMRVDMPSCVACLSTPPAVPDTVNDRYMESFYDKMVLSFKSPVIKEDRYVVFGAGAVSSGRSLTQFDIASANYSKCQQDLSGILVLGSVVSLAMRDYWERHGELPDDVLHVTAGISLALPIDEYTHYRDAFEKKFYAHKHYVTVHNFEHNVQLEVEFRSVNVMPEGVSAQFAISAAGIGMIQSLLNSVRASDPNALPGITAEDIFGCKNTCGIDIGEGTVNIPVITESEFNQIASATLQKGYGTVLEQAVPRVLNANMPYDTRKALAAFLQSPDTPFNRAKKRTCKDIINAEAKDLVNDIIREVSHVLSAGTTEVIYVYGGGATPMKEALYPALVEKTTQFSGGDAFPIMYLDSSIARNLNRTGLYNAAMMDAENSGLLDEWKAL